MAGGTFELWLVDLAAAAPALEALERQHPCLHADDIARARRPKDRAEQRRRLAAYMALRLVLGRVGGAHLRDMRMARSPEGRPHLGTAGPAFSLAHTGTRALIGVVLGEAIGVDLEGPRRLAMPPRRREETLAVGRGLAPRPAKPVNDGAADILQAWCRLEACAKARGTGISALLGELGLRAAHGRTLPLAAIEAAARQLARRGNLAVRDAALPHDLFGAVAIIGGPRLTGRPTTRTFPTTLAAIKALLA